MTDLRPQIRVVRIFVSSPSDVAKERKALDEVVDRINKTDGDRLGVRLELFRWEDDVVPRIGPPPQTVVDEQTPECDVYLGILSGRFGTPTGKFGSGTEKEFRDAYQRHSNVGQPWILFYFKDPPPVPKSSADIAQLGKVIAFREELEKLGLIGRYKSQSFVTTVEQHLRMLLKQLEAPRAETHSTAERQVRVPPGYRDWLRGECAELELLGLRLQHGQTLRLNHIYVPLISSERRRDKKTRRDSQAETSLAVNEEGLPKQDDKPQLLLDWLGHESLYVSGPPGSGKSTFSKWVAWLACAGAIPVHDVIADKDHTESFPSDFQNRLPLLVRLRDFWKYLPLQNGEPSRSGLEAALAHWLAERDVPQLDGPLLRAHLEQGSALLIFDGVDEVPPTEVVGEQQVRPRELLLNGLSAAVSEWGQAGNRVLVTSRPYGLDEAAQRKLGLTAATVTDLDQPLQQLLVKRWFDALDDSQEQGAETAGRFLAHVGERPELAPLTANPMLLTAACVIYGQGKRLPQDKYELYDRIIDNVLFNRYPLETRIIALERGRLSVIAHGMHTGAGLQEDRATPEAQATVDELDRMLSAYQDSRRGKEPGYRDAVTAREQLLSRSGLLLPQGHNRAGFYHLTFQDFLAAQRILDLECESVAELANLFALRALQPEWHSTLSFVFSSYLAKNTSSDKPVQLLELMLDRVSGEEPLPTWGLPVVAADCLQILLGHGLQLHELRQEQFRQICLASFEHEAPVKDRHHLGVTLGLLGDPRIIDDLRDPAAYVTIPADTYLLGDDKQPQRIEQPFAIARYPVTNSQYRVFVEAGGYKNAKCWTDEGWTWRMQNEITEPRYWQDGKWNRPNLPVVGVCAHEADAFAAWVGGRLPTNEEWEAAARGTDGRIYPWGDDWEDGRCNALDREFRRTLPVGAFPRSESVFEVHDMSGNVWQWVAGTGSERVLRGGSCFDHAHCCRCSYRGTLHAHRRGNGVGFRVVCCSPRTQ